MRRTVTAAVCFTAAAIFAAIAIMYGIKYHQANKAYDEVRKEAVVQKDTEEEEDDGRLIIDFDAMKARNPDYVGWIEMDTGTSYPVVRAEDNDKYLHCDFDGNYSFNGAIFMHCDNDPSWRSKNTILYGHNMTNGSMFGKNKLYANPAYAKEHPYFYIHIRGGYYVYRVFDYILAEDTTEPYETQLFSEKSFGKYIEHMRPLSSYWIEEAAPEKGDRIVTLSTCKGRAGGTHRQLIQGKLERFVPYSKLYQKMAGIR